MRSSVLGFWQLGLAENTGERPRIDIVIRFARYLPATVTTPVLVACLYWRRLPRTRSMYQPSASMRLITSRTFTSHVHPITGEPLVSLHSPYAGRARLRKPVMDISPDRRQPVKLACVQHGYMSITALAASSAGGSRIRSDGAMTLNVLTFRHLERIYTRLRWRLAAARDRYVEPPPRTAWMALRGRRAAGVGYGAVWVGSSAQRKVCMSTDGTSRAVRCARGTLVGTYLSWYLAYFGES